MIEYRSIFTETVASRREIKKLTALILEELASTKAGTRFIQIGYTDIPKRYGSGELKEFLADCTFFRIILQIKKENAKASFVFIPDAVRFDDQWIELNLQKDEFHTFLNADAYDYHKRTVLKNHESALLHELTHAYDSWRSRGHALQDITKAIDSIENKTDEEKSIDYLNYKHEIDARLAQTLDKGEVVKAKLEKSLKVYLMKFWNNFLGASVLKDDMRKYLVKKVSTEYYDLSPEEKEYVMGSMLTKVFWDMVYGESPDYTGAAKDVLRYTGNARTDAKKFASDLAKGTIPVIKLFNDNQKYYNTDYLQYISYPYAGVTNALNEMINSKDFESTYLPLFNKEFGWTPDDIKKIQKKYRWIK